MAARVKLSDCAWSKDDAMGGAAVLEVAELLTLRDVVAGLDVGVDDAGGEHTTSRRSGDDSRISGLNLIVYSSPMTMIQR
jgi:hypothetical protein